MSDAPGTPLGSGPVVGSLLAIGHLAAMAAAVAVLPAVAALPVTVGLVLSLAGCCPRRAAAGEALVVTAAGAARLVDGEGRHHPIHGTVLHPGMIAIEPAGAPPRLLAADAVPDALLRRVSRTLRWGGTAPNVNSVAESGR